MTKILCGECIHNSDKGGGCLIPKNLGYVDNCNRYLPKDRPIVQTNEEWFDGLSTEEKAEWLSKHFHCGDCIFEKPMCGGEYDGCKSAFVEWLKEEHR